MTRDGDHDIDVDRRTQVANHHRADLFLSLHAGGDFGHTARGVVVCHQGPVSALGAKSSQQRSGSWREDEDPPPWKDLWTRHSARSRDLAVIVYENLAGDMSPKRNRIRQAPVLALEGADMPAVLVEIGCLTHPTEETSLKTAEGISAVSESICGAINEYFRKYP